MVLKNLYCYYFILFLPVIAVAQQPRLVLPIGHTKDVFDIAFSSNGKYVVTGSSDYSVKMWAANTGDLLFSLDDAKREINSVSFSPDDKQIMAAAMDNKIYTWDAHTGRLLKEIQLDDCLGKAYYSPDGSSIITNCYGKIMVIDTASGKIEFELPGHTGIASTFAMSSDGKYIVSSDYREGKVWNRGDGSLAFIVEKGFKIGRKVSFSADGKNLLVFNDKGICRFLDLSTGAVLKEFKLEAKEFNSVETISLTHDGSRILTYPIFGRLVNWDVSTGQKLGTSECCEDYFALAFSNNWKFVAGCSANGGYLFDLENLRELRRFQGYSNYINPLMFSPDGNEIYSQSEGKAHVWDAKTGQLTRTMEGMFSNMNPVAYYKWGRRQMDSSGFRSLLKKAGTLQAAIMDSAQTHTRNVWLSSDGQYVMMNDRDLKGYYAKLFRVRNQKMTGFYRNVLSLDVSEDQKRVVTIAQDGTFCIRDLSTQKIISQLKKKPFSLVSFSPDGRYILSHYEDRAEILHGKDGRLHFSIPVETSFWPIQFSPDGQWLITTSSSDTCRIWDINTGKLIRELTSPVSHFQFSPSGKLVMTTNWGDDTVEMTFIVKTVDGEKVSQLPGRALILGKYSTAMISPDDTYVIMSEGTESHILNRFDIKTGKLVCRFIAIKENDYFNVTTEGYYQATPAAVKLLHYVTSDLKVISFEQFDVKYNRPDKALEAIGNTDTALIRSYRKAWEKRIKKLGIDTTAFRDDYSVPEADFANRDAIEFEQKNRQPTLHIKGIDSTYKLDRFNIWVNEVPVFGQRGISIRKRNKNDIDTTLTIKLSQGENRIETSITNVNSTESYRMPLVVNYTPAIKQKETTRFIGIGIDQFADDQYNLKYSAKDIRDLSVKLKEKFKDNIIIDTIFNEQVTISTVKALKQKLQQTTENDKVIIAYSGHGMLSKEFDYYLSTYNVNFEKPEQNGLPYEELENLLDSIPARKKLLLIDACHSGEVDKEDLVKLNATSDSLIKGLKPVGYKQEGQLGLKNSFELMQSLFVNVGKSTGATVISAAAGTQFALERNDLKNGVFTYSILEAMNKHATMKISELKKIVGERVEQITNGLQKPTSRNETIAVDWSLW